MLKVMTCFFFFSKDILFGLLRKQFLSKDPSKRKFPLKVIVMSATLDIERLSEFFNNCPVVTIPGKVFPIKEKFLNLIGPRDKDNTAYIAEVCDSALHITNNKHQIYFKAIWFSMHSTVTNNPVYDTL